MPPEPVVAGVAVDPAEVAKFDAVAHRFWDPDGEFKPLHALNPLRAASCRNVGQSFASASLSFSACPQAAPFCRRCSSDAGSGCGEYEPAASAFMPSSFASG